MAGLAALGVAGVNVTYPLKAAVLPHLAECSPAVARASARPTCSRLDEGGFRGENTDAGGTALARRAAGLAGADGPRGGDPRRRWGRPGGGPGPAGGGCRGGGPPGARPGAGRGRPRPACARPGAGTAMAVSALGSAEAAPASPPPIPRGAGHPGGPGRSGRRRRWSIRRPAPRAVGFELVYGARPTAFARPGAALVAPASTAATCWPPRPTWPCSIWLDTAPDLAAMRRTIATEEVRDRS